MLRDGDGHSTISVMGGQVDTYDETYILVYRQEMIDDLNDGGCGYAEIQVLGLLDLEN